MKKFDKNVQIKILKIILVLIWMITIFIFSSQQGTESGDTSRRFTVKIIHILTGKQLNPNNSIVENAQFLIRKLAHFTVYAIGGFLIMNYAYTINKTTKQKILYSIAFGGTYAITDEFHQFFVPGRSARIFDVGIDTAGVITGIVMYLLLRRIIRLIVNKNTNV